MKSKSLTKKRSDKETESSFYKFFENISPAELAKLRGKQQETSTRDKTLLLKKVSEIEDILNKLDIEISLKKVK